MTWKPDAKPIPIRWQRSADTLITFAVLACEGRHKMPDGHTAPCAECLADLTARALQAASDGKL